MQSIKFFFFFYEQKLKVVSSHLVEKKEKPLSQTHKMPLTQDCTIIMKWH